MSQLPENNKPLNPDFDINYQFSQYLKMVGFTPDRMGPIQYKETQQAFFAGIASTLVLFQAQPGMVPAEFSLNLSNVYDQLAVYWEGKKIENQAKQN